MNIIMFYQGKVEELPIYHLLGDLPMGAFIYDPQNQFVCWSKIGTSFGVPVRKVQQFVHPEDVPPEYRVKALLLT